MDGPPAGWPVFFLLSLRSRPADHPGEMTTTNEQAGPPRSTEPMAGFAGVLAAAAEGVDWAWHRLVRSYSAALLGYIRMRGASEPEDVLGDVWLTAARRIHSFSGEEPAFRSWLFVIAHRRALDARRRRMRKPARPEAPSVVAERDPRRIASAEDQALAALSHDGAMRMLDVLTEDQRDVVALRVVAGLSLEETAAVVGKRVGAVKALQRRGLEALRRSLGRPGVSP